MSTIQLAEKAILKMVAAEEISNRYGNRRKARNKAMRELREGLAAKGYSNDEIEQVRRDVFDLVELELNAATGDDAPHVCDDDCRANGCPR